MNKIQIHIIQAQSFQLICERLFCAFIALRLYKELGSDKEFVSFYTALPDRLSYSFLITVRNGCVYKAIAHIKGIGDTSFAFCEVVYLKNTEPKYGHFYSVVQFYRLHCFVIYGTKVVSSSLSYVIPITVLPTIITVLAEQTVKWAGKA